MSSSECSTRCRTASPVTPLHRALDSQGGMSVMLSKLNAHEARAKMAHSRLVPGRGPVGGRLRVDQGQQGPDQVRLGRALLALDQEDGVRDAGQVGGHHPADGQPVILLGQVDQLPEPVQGAAALGLDEGVGELGAAEDHRGAGLHGPAGAG